ncbi:2-oxoglutarate-dependent dioxygenase DAO-like [Dendrobium catenatum]|uniref:2-oxoglutarate-dependent dioxygenase DAO-like n=1 Tax=Dendrobium catenatum TaxID=906689 RepID=UPI0009F38336|nr:2-oxoglutarate-dependent dioxygenase DAO-like [Dendrobium catenatum]
MAVEEIIVPIIDLANFEAEKEKLMEAVSGLGFFRVINHGILEEIVVDMKALVRYLFELPYKMKQRNIDIFPNSGYVEPSRFNHLYEGLGIYDASSPFDIQAFCSLLDLSSHDKETLGTYATKLHDLIVDLASKVAEGLGIIEFSFQEWPCHLRMNRCLFTKETMLGTCGVNTHSDTSFITILLEDDSHKGLEILDSFGNFVAINPVPGTFLVNIGDIGMVWSNGKLHNVKHRVICKKSKPRISIALFMQGPKDNKIEPRAELIDSEHPQLYRSFDYLEYRKLRGLTATMVDDVLHNWVIAEPAIMP